MSTTEPSSIPGNFTRRRPVTVSADDLVTQAPLQAGSNLPLVIEPKRDFGNLDQWLREKRDSVEEALLKHACILFRGFGISSTQRFDEIASAFSGNLLEYRERSSPRSKVSGNVYTSTDYPPDQPIFLHNENSYQKSWPMKIFFGCITAAETGGATPIADVRKVFARLSQTTRDGFAQKGVMYTRNFGQGLGLPWEEVFQTQDRSVVDEHCRKNGMVTEWLSGNRLRTRVTRRAMMKHPKTHEWVWFNHATFFHISTREPEVRASLLELIKEEDLPTNSYYGDGSPIEPDVLNELREAYNLETIRFPWQQGDVMLLDNMLAAHGRDPYSGKRQVVVAMADPKESEPFHAPEQALR